MPLFAALGMLLASNLAGNGVVGISPYGSVFALARLVGDGPGRAYIDRVCPEAGYRLCAWKGRLSSDSDEFLWHPQGPLWADEFGPKQFAPEASRIVAATIAAYPMQVLQAAAANTLRQLVTGRIGDTLGPDHLDAAVLPRLQLYFPVAEVRRYAAGLQVRGLLRRVAAPFQTLHLALLCAGGFGAVWVLVAQWRRDRALAGLAALALVGLLANAFATGALSGPHDRYQARIAWLVLLPPLFSLRRPRYAARLATSPVGYAASLATSSGDMRTSAS